MTISNPSQKTLNKTLDTIYHWSKENQLKGYNKHDGLNSPILKFLFGWSKWPRLVAIQTVMRFPVNIRPLLFIPKTHNPKGLALFVLGLFDIYKSTKNENYLHEAEDILSLLISLQSPGHYAGQCWGYHYPWQDAGFFAPTNTPNAVVTCFVCEAFLEAYRITHKSLYLDTVHSSIQFFLNDLKVLKDKDEQLCLSYMPMAMTMRVMDVSILIASVISQYRELSSDTSYSDKSYRLANYVISQQTNEGAWFYTDPPSDSHITHDNYHTGFILDALWRYMTATNDFRWKHEYEMGLKFYAERLFNADGSPKWMYNKDFPHDIHGAAQGILTFSRHLDKYNALANNIYYWSINNMYHDQGRFFYQQNKYWTKKFTLLRWCNGWMFRANAKFLWSNMKQNNLK